MECCNLFCTKEKAGGLTGDYCTFSIPILFSTLELGHNRIMAKSTLIMSMYVPEINIPGFWEKVISENSEILIFVN